MIDNLTEATRLLNATQLMLLGKDNQPISDLYYALQIAVDAIEELQERREADRWIPVSERLPDKEGKCFVFTDYGDVTMDSFVDGMFVCNLGNVTHWKPLPKAPESEDE